jgi:hypothetical protein
LERKKELKKAKGSAAVEVKGYDSDHDLVKEFYKDELSYHLSRDSDQPIKHVKRSKSSDPKST